MPEYIDTNVSAVVSFVGPFLVIGALGLWKVRMFWDTHTAVSSTSSFSDGGWLTLDLE